MCGPQWITEEMDVLVWNFEEASRPKYGKCAPIGVRMNRDAKRLLRTVVANQKALDKMENRNKLQSEMANDLSLADSSQACYFSDIFDSFEPIRLRLRNMPVENSEKKLIGRINSLMNYMSFVDYNGQCPAEEIAVSCQTIHFFTFAEDLYEITESLANLSRHYNAHCPTYDFTTQYFARWLSS